MRTITQEETFGPVVALSTFDGTDATAVRLANDSTYGLTASVYSGDLARAGRVAAQISAGQVGINTNPLSGARSILSPFCGHKRSGYGSHSGRDGWRQFSTPKTLIYTARPAVTDLPVQAQPSLPSAKVEVVGARGGDRPGSVDGRRRGARVRDARHPEGGRSESGAAFCVLQTIIYITILLTFASRARRRACSF